MTKTNPPLALNRRFDSNSLSLTKAVAALLGLVSTLAAVDARAMEKSSTHRGPSSIGPVAVVSPISAEQQRLRLEHAQELLGKYYRKSKVRYGENVAKINDAVYRWTRDRLPGRDKKSYQKISQTIIDESLKHEFDPVFLLSIIQSESEFNPRARGTSGEIGLMQLMPQTAEWMAAKLDIRWVGPQSLFDPTINIRLGAAYLAYLRDRFDMHAQLYIAAYNMGQGNVDSAQQRNIWPRDYPSLVMRNYIEFYQTLRQRKNASRATGPGSAS